jgi:hypothetical protein
MRSVLFFLLMCIIAIDVTAQNKYNITGIINDEKGQAVKSATVFISGSEKVTISDENGHFSIKNLPPGNYQLSVSMLGYALLTKPVMLQNKQVDITLTLQTKSIILNTVKIGGVNKAWDRNYYVFKEQFLGKTQNGLQCEILNPQVLSFGTNKDTLTAEAEDFLIIENKRLGYRIRYRLKYFSYNTKTQNLGYDGESSFEHLDAKAYPKNQWLDNRLETYNGSMMHFLRSAYNNTALKQGFLTYRVLKETRKFAMNASTYTEVGIDKRPIKFDTVVNIIDDSFISLAATHLYVIYNPSATAKIKTSLDVPKPDLITLDRGSTLKFYLNKAIIDSRGSYADYRTFLIKGEWSKLRIGDQLPFEYLPPL